MKTKFFAVLLTSMFGVNLFASPLTESTFTDVVKDVNKVAADTKAAQPAKVNDLVKAPDLVRTGPESRAELTAPDNTITRIGANTVFSFQPSGREINLERGSLLFHSPSGKGGGTIKSGGAAAAVLGTTIVVVATPGGGFKVIVLEGKGKVVFLNGKTITLNAGQLIFVLAGQKRPGKVLDINLGKLVAGSQLVNGFSTTLASLGKINEAIEKQNEELASGRIEDTGVPPDPLLNNGRPPNGSGSIDNNTYSTLALPFGRQELPPPGTGFGNGAP